ncbi:MAG: hypothetical protein EAZ18_19745 [Oscillatoriales cyanobacterium]|nr:MAG: hypothetical protein EAZ18_19745 [Oscillatoriales cyanobacterium]
MPVPQDNKTIYLSKTGKMPVPQDNLSFKNRQDACSTRQFILCGTGILPVHKKLIENTTPSIR